MKPDPNDNNDPLDKALQSWQVTTPLPPRFQEQVWRRIARAGAAEQTTFWAGFWNWLEMTLPRRSVTVSYLTIVLVAGVTIGQWKGREKAARLESGLGQRYIQSIDPYQMPRTEK